jgi:hypothetical protein
MEGGVYNVSISQESTCSCPGIPMNLKHYVIDFFLANIYFGYITFTFIVTTSIASIKAHW